MPNIWTHLIFGQHVLERLKHNDWIRSDFERNMFHLGCQGPDFLFYHNFLPWKKDKRMNAIGSAMHKEQCGPLLVDMFRTMNGRTPNESNSLYVIGFLLHHVLDRNMHPYVFVKSGFKKWNHQKFEVMLDTIFAAKYLNIDTWRTPVWKYIHIGPSFPDPIVKMFREVTPRWLSPYVEGVSDDDWNAAYRDMISAQWLFHDPSGIRRMVTFGQISPMVYKRKLPDVDLLNEQKLTWKDPSEPEQVHHDSVWDLYEKAMIDGVRAAGKAIAYLDAAAQHQNDEADALLLELEEVIGNRSYETGKPCDSGLDIIYEEPII